MFIAGQGRGDNKLRRSGMFVNEDGPISCRSYGLVLPSAARSISMALPWSFFSPSNPLTASRII